MGSVESAAVIVFLGGKTRYSLPGNRFMVHPSSWTFDSSTNDYQTIRNAFNYLEALRKQYVKIYLEGTAGSEQPIDIEKCTTTDCVTLIDDLAVSAGICTSLIAPSRLNTLAEVCYPLKVSCPPGKAPI